MFGEIAPRYDFLNRLLSFGIDRAWRRRTIASLDLPEGSEVLDLCCGTGDLALAFAQSGASVCGADFTLPMLQAAVVKGRKAKGASKNNPGTSRNQPEISLRWLQADAQALPFADGSFDAVTIAFGIRNVEDPQLGLSECQRVLRPSGRLAILEFFPIPNPIWRGLFRFYFLHVLPLIAKVVRAGRTGAYRYLPESVDNFATPKEFQQWMEGTGLHFEQDLPLTGGVARLFIARKEPKAS